MSHVGKKGSIPWVILENGSVLWVMFQKKFNFLSHQKKVSLFLIFFTKTNSSSHFFEKGIILWDKFLEESSSLRVICKKVQLFEFCESYLKRTNQFLKFLWVIFKKKRVQFFESYFNKFNPWVTFFKRFNSWRSYFWKRAQIFESYIKKQGSILWVIKKRVQFIVTYIKEASILSVMWKKSNSLNHIKRFKKGWLFRVSHMFKGFQF